jgi:hypothetical protein
MSLSAGVGLWAPSSDTHAHVLARHARDTGHTKGTTLHDPERVQRLRPDFAGLRYFDAHRVGEYCPGEYDGPLEDWTAEQGRRCLTTEELHERGFDEMLAGAGTWSPTGSTS